MIEDGTKEKNLKKDNAPVKRVELRAYNDESIRSE